MPEIVPLRGLLPSGSTDGGSDASVIWLVSSGDIRRISETSVLCAVCKTEPIASFRGADRPVLKISLNREFILDSQDAGSMGHIPEGRICPPSGCGVADK
jgi:hypothetical protein